MPRFRITPVTFASEELAGRKGRTCRPGAPRRTHPPDRCKAQETHARDSLVSVVGGRQFARHFAQQRVSMGRARRYLLRHCVCALLVKHKPGQARAVPARAAAAPAAGSTRHHRRPACSGTRANSAGARATRERSAPPKKLQHRPSLPHQHNSNNTTFVQENGPTNLLLNRFPTSLDLFRWLR